jgi:hypothetical protein
LLPQILSVQTLPLKEAYCRLFTSLALTTPKSSATCDPLHTLFDIVYNQWIPTHPSNAYILQCLGYLSNYLSQSKLLSLQNTLLNLYKN